MAHGHIYIDYIYKYIHPPRILTCAHLQYTIYVCKRYIHTCPRPVEPLNPTTLFLSCDDTYRVMLVLAIFTILARVECLRFQTQTCQSGEKTLFRVFFRLPAVYEGSRFKDIVGGQIIHSRMVVNEEIDTSEVIQQVIQQYKVSGKMGT